MKLITLALLIMFLVRTPVLCQTPPTSGLRGQVYAIHFGGLLSDIELTLLRDGKVIKAVKSDAEGNYQINDIPSGNYSIDIEERGFKRKRLDIEVASGKQTLLDIGIEIGHWENVSTPQDFTIRGKVSQLNGKGIARARVVVVSPFNGNRLAEAITDEKGQYRLPAMEGQFVIYASRPGYMVRCESVLLRVTSTDDQRTMNFILEPFESK